eukprot:g46204.t1
MTEQLPVTQNTAATIILSLACLVGVPGNALVIWIVLFAMKKQRSPTVILILNLAIADELVLITLPLWIYAFVNGWAFGQPFCKFLSYIVCCNMYVSIFLITVMSIERFMAVIYPFASQRWRQNKVVVKVVFIVWVLALLFSIPVLLYQVVDADDTGQQYCLYMQFETDKEEIFCTVFQTLVSFVIPFMVLSISYFCIGRKVKRMTFNTKNRTGVWGWLSNFPRGRFPIGCLMTLSICGGDEQILDLAGPIRGPAALDHGQLLRMGEEASRNKREQ